MKNKVLNLGKLFGVIWITSIVVFFIYIYLTFSGKPQDWILFSIVLTGVVAFLLMVTLLVVYFMLKIRKKRHILIMVITPIILIALAILVFIIVALKTESNPALTNSVPTYTGYDLLNSVNKYRKEQGKPPLILHEPLCNNLAERWQRYKDTNSHEGIQEFIDSYMPKDEQISEALIYAISPEDAVMGWRGSPGHNEAILNNTKACSYSHEGYNVLMMSK